MDLVYMLVQDGGEWEDMQLFVCKEEAINASIKYPKRRVEIFSKRDTLGYMPTYNYYRNGEYIEKS